MDNEEQMKKLKWQMEDIKEQMRVLADQGGDEAKQHIKGYVDMVSDAVKGYVDGSSTAVREKLNQAGDATKRVGAKADGYAHENPWHVAAIGVAVGLAVGALLSRDRS